MQPCQDWRHELYQHCPTCQAKEFEQDIAAAPAPEKASPQIPPRRQSADPTSMQGYSDTY